MPRTVTQRKQPQTASVVPFIECKDDGTYVVHDEAIEFLSKLPAPIGIASIVGPYRSGKSTLLNHCLLQKQVVTAGSTINACTKGILLVKELMYAPNPIPGEPAMPMIVLDTEGLGSIDATNTHDVRIFSIALLLSSLFIYNSVGSIDENALSNLSLVANICKTLKLTDDSSHDPSSDGIDHAEQLGREAFPPLIWIVRDFGLELRDPSGHPISPAQYLEQVLQAQQTSSAATQEAAGLLAEKNRLRRYIKACFPTRQCFTMVRPVSDEADLQALSRSIKLPAIRELFVQQMQYVRSYIMQKIKPKQISNGINLSGSGLVTYAKAIVDSINQGEHPVIHETWALISTAQVRDIFDSAKSSFAAKTKDVTNKALLTPATAATAHSEIETFAEDVVRNFKNHPCVKQHSHLSREYSEQLCSFIQSERDAFSAVANRMIQTEFTELVSSLGSYLNKYIIEASSDNVATSDLDAIVAKVSGIKDKMIAAFEKMVDGAPQELTASLAIKLHKQMHSWLSKLVFAAVQNRNKCVAAEAQVATLEAQCQQQAHNEQQQQIIDKLTNETASRIVSLETELADVQLSLDHERERSADAVARLEAMEIDFRAATAQLEAAHKTAELSSGRAADEFDAKIREAEHAAQTKYIHQLEIVRAEINAKLASQQHEYETKSAADAADAAAAKLASQQHEAVRIQMQTLVSELKADIAKLQELRVVEVLEWSKRIAESEKTAATAIVQKRHLEEMYDPNVTKRCRQLEQELSTMQVELKFKDHEIQRLGLELSESKASAARWQSSFYDARCKHQEELLFARCIGGPTKTQTSSSSNGDTFF